VDDALIAAPSLTKNKDNPTHHKLHSSQKGNQWHFGMKAHTEVDADSRLMYPVRCTSGNVHDITQGTDCRMVL
jgi:IS5 family transposase